METADVGARQRVEEAFKVALELGDGVDVPSLVYQGVETWDSVGHMQLVAELEDRFDVLIDTEDIIDISSFDKAIEVLERYGVSFGA